MFKCLRNFFNQPKPDPREVIVFDLRNHVADKSLLGYYDLKTDDADRIQGALIKVIHDARQKNAIVEIDLDVIDDGYTAAFLHRLFAPLPQKTNMTPREVINTLRLVSFESPSYVMESLEYILKDSWHTAKKPKP